MAGLGCSIVRRVAVAMAAIVPLQHAGAADDAPNNANPSWSAPDHGWPSLPAALRRLTDQGGLRSQLSTPVCNLLSLIMATHSQILRAAWGRAWVTMAASARL